MKILLVDDEEDIRLVASVSLQRMGGFQVILATSGEEAIELASNERPDVILMDFMMPDMNGEALLEKIRNDEKLRRIPVIFLTAKAKPTDVQRLLRLGAKGVIGKPFDPTHLSEEVQRILRS